MPRVLPFAGLRYAAPPSELARLVSPPYDVISPDEQAELRALSPHNAVHIELPLDADGQPCSRYTSAAETLARWRSEGILMPEQRPAFYLSETEYAYGGETLRRRDLLAALDAAWTAADARPPTVEFTWRGERHRVWLVDDQASLADIQAGFERGGPLYIADGHHRYETGLAFKAEAQTSVPGAGAILATVSWADDPGLLALPTHRLLAGLDPDLTLEEAETRWSDAFHVEYYPVWDPAPAEQIDALIQQLASSGRAAPSFGVYGLGHLDLFGILELRGRKPPEGALPAERSDAWKSLDVSLLHTLLVDPLVAETGRPREQVLGYTRDVHEAFAAVRDGRASVAFFLNPTPVSGVLAVADANDRMPEKSTYFHPKPPAGLVMRDLNTTP